MCRGQRYLVIISLIVLKGERKKDPTVRTHSAPDTYEALSALLAWFLCGAEKQPTFRKPQKCALKAQKKLEQDLTLGYGFQVHASSLILGRVNKDARNTNQGLGQRKPSFPAFMCQITRGLKLNFPKSAFATPCMPTFPSYISCPSVTCAVLSGSFPPDSKFVLKTCSETASLCW